MTHGRKRTRWDQRNIITWDGEGARVFHVDRNGVASAVHIFNLLANGRGVDNFIGSPDRIDGLHTAECLEFFLANDTISAIHVIFAGGYDVNMLLRDLPREKLTQLWKLGRVQWGQYRIVYRNRKMFSVAKWDKEKNKGRGGWGRSFVLWDVFGFFQSSFVKAIRKWLKDDESLEMIQDMKDTRSKFTPLDWDEIVHYNAQECRLLELLMVTFFRAMDEAGMRLSRFDGAGAIASVMLRENDVKSHMGEIPEWVYRQVQVSYAGGRVEAPRIGVCNTDIYRHDVNSAYPTACLGLPSWKDVDWIQESRPAYATDPSCVASMVAIEWSYRDEAPFYPLFYRTHDGEILYPRRGSGIYWHPEYDSLSNRYTEGRDYVVLYAINAYSPHPDVRPFEFIADGYQQRLAYKRAGNMAQESWKLGLNSVYGKLAQQEGYQPAIPGVCNERFPSYHNLAWASLITSTTRANVYQAGIMDGEAVVAFATDALFTTRCLEHLPVGDQLGTWSVDRFDGITIVQPGVYWLKSGPEWSSKYRGFDPDSLSREKVINAWEREGGDGTVSVTLTRFVGMGTALARTNFEGVWRTWETQRRTLDVIPKGKRRPLSTRFAEGLCDTIAVENVSEAMSAPYPIVWIDGYRSRPKDENGIDIRLAEEEWEDSWL